VELDQTWDPQNQIQFSVPLELDPDDVNSFFEPALGLHDRSIWRVVTYAPELGRYLEYGQDPNFPGIVPGRAYWLSMTETQGVSLTVGGTRVDQDREFRVSLRQGYNQFGTGFLYSVAYDDVEFEKDGVRLSVKNASKQGWVANQLWYTVPSSGEYRYDVAGFGRVTTIDPWLGYWLYAKVDVDLIIPPIPSNQSNAIRLASLDREAVSGTPVLLDALKSNAVMLTSEGGLMDENGNLIDSCGLGWDIARSMIRWQGGYLVLDGFGGLHALGGAEPMESSLNFGFDIARRLVSTGEGVSVLDGFGGIHGGNLPQAVHFESDLARDLELVPAPAEESGQDSQLPPLPSPPGSARESASGAYYLLDAYGRVYPAGGARQQGYPELDAPVARDLAVTPSGQGYYVVDAYGNVYGYGDAVVYSEETPVFDHARIERIIAVEGGYYLLDCFGQVYPAGKAKKNRINIAIGFDSIRDILLN
jgi:hypothetical protein